MSLPITIESIAKGVFSHCLTLRECIFATGVTITCFPEEAFSYTGLTAIVVPRTMKSIERRCFYQCGSLTDVTWEKGIKLEVVEEEAFENSALGRFLVLPSLVFIGARVIPQTTQIVLAKGDKMPIYQEWRRLYTTSRDHVHGTRPRQGEGGGAGATANQSGCCQVM
jgi:hypothetical protein